jgi:putative PIN family toxin of toxin-antitoxin system
MFSSLLKRGDVPEAIVSRVLEREIVLCVTEPMAVEYEEILKRGKFKKLDQRKVRELLFLLRSQGRRVTCKFHLQVARADPGDNKFLECAEEVGADLRQVNWKRGENRTVTGSPQFRTFSRKLVLIALKEHIDLVCVLLRLGPACFSTGSKQ